ncbi:Nucleotidyltransferase, partial [Russula vinacea]
DFIAFRLEDGPELPAHSHKESKEEPRERDWDKGKGRAHERDGIGGRKRKADLDRGDGYNNKKERLDAASRKAPWVTNVDWEGSANVSELLHREVEAFVNYISPTREEDEVRSLAVILISQAISKRFPDAKVFAFGSYETKLYLPLGDIDLVVISPSMAYSDRITVLHALANTLKRAGITDKVTIIAKAKVPIVKFVTTHGYFPVDISVNQENGVEVGRVVSGFLSEMPALRALVFIAKSFLSQRSMNEVFSGGLGSYSIVCLAVSFLQMHPKIRRGEIDPSRNLGVLVMEFFEFYGLYFNYHEVGISLRDGGTYFNKARRGWMDYRQSLLSIEDPADSTNDISKGSYNIARVRQTFAGAYGIMTAAAYMKASVLNSRRSGRSANLRGYAEPADLSILSSVLGVTQEV